MRRKETAEWHKIWRQLPLKSARKSTSDPDRPFDPQTVARAERLAGRYHIEIEVRQEPTGYVGTVAELPAVFGCGASREAAVGKTRELLKWAVAYLLEVGRTPPPPNPAV